MKKSTIAVAGAAAVALTLAACGAAPDGDGASAEPTREKEDIEIVDGFKACMVSDQGGWDDQSFNQSGYEGLTDAEEFLGVEINAVESTSDSEYAPNIDSLITDGCTYIIGVGFLLEPGIQAAAEKNPDIQFALIDSSLSNDDFSLLELPNVKPLLFNTAEAAFLAGYAAAGTTESGIVGTFGGLPLPSVKIFMDGFYDGVQQYNEDNDTDVKVLGWDKADQEGGSFTGDFENQANGTTTAQGFLDQGADIIMPVAGPVGLGAATAVQSADGKLIWVDSDGFLSTEYGDIIMTSVMKEIGEAVYASIRDAAQGEFDATPYVGTLENGGVALAPFHDFEDSVPAELADKIADYQKRIISGDFVVESVNTP